MSVSFICSSMFSIRLYSFAFVVLPMRNLLVLLLVGGIFLSRDLRALRVLGLSFYMGG